MLNVILHILIHQGLCPGLLSMIGTSRLDWSLSTQGAAAKSSPEVYSMS
jgi:hypothetical protein